MGATTSTVFVRIVDAPHVLVAGLSLRTTVGAAGLTTLLPDCDYNHPVVVVGQYGTFPNETAYATVHIQAGIPAIADE
jgi:hypothetical protein